MRCPHCSGPTEGLVVLADIPEVPDSPTRKATARIAKRQEPKAAKVINKALSNMREQLNEENLAKALAQGTVEAVETVPVVGALTAEEEALFGVFSETQTLTGTSTGGIVTEASGIDFEFNGKDPNAVAHARTQTATLVVAVSETTKEAIRIIIAAGQEIGLTTVQQARLIRDVVGLPPNWVEAPFRLYQNILDGETYKATNRRLSAVDKARIRKRIKDGTVDEAFALEMREKYAKSLLNRRALNIARTETMRAANVGQRESWRQAQAEGALPPEAKRIVIVTPDKFLRESHAQVALDNSGGVGINEPFKTPWGALMDPPWATQPNCRCGEGLIFPGLVGIL